MGSMIRFLLVIAVCAIVTTIADPDPGVIFGGDQSDNSLSSEVVEFLLTFDGDVASAVDAIVNILDQEGFTINELVTASLNIYMANET